MSGHDVDAVVRRIRHELDDDIWSADIQLVLESLKPGDRLPGRLVVVPEEATQAMMIAALEAFLEMQPPMARVEEGQELSESEAAQRFMDLGARVRNGKEMAAIYRAMRNAASGSEG